MGLFNVFFAFFWGGGVVFALDFLYAFHFVTKQLCRKYALLSNINWILFIYSYPTSTPLLPAHVHTSKMRKCSFKRSHLSWGRTFTSNLLWIQLPHDYDYDSNRNYCARHKKESCMCHYLDHRLYKMLL